ncbi:MAG: class I SAM-dependent methyltransferase [Chloroflexi bacterium]|nr:MAG: class I SAM-dependent methyltransferase [Chloroflexota bacterium]
MTLDEFYFLLSPAGQKALAQIAKTPITPKNHLHIVTYWREKLPPGQAQAVVETALLRQLAQVKFTRAMEMYFTRPALEQASAEIVARWRAERFARLGLQRMADLGCGIGGDALALAAHAEVTGVEWDVVRLAMAQENVRVYGYGERFRPLQADIKALTPTKLSVEALFFDPARRDERGRRFYSVHLYQPPFSVVAAWQAVFPETAVKISPGVDYAELPAEAEVEFISVNGEVREGVLWFGALRTSAKRRATLLPGEHTLTDEDLTETAVTPPKAILYEPDGAIIRAHLVQALAPHLQATLIDPQIAYLTADTFTPTPFARAYAIHDILPFQLKQLRHYLRHHHIGHVTIKKRGSPLNPDTLRQQLRLKGPNQCTLFLTHVNNQPTVLIAHPIPQQKKSEA